MLNNDQSLLKLIVKHQKNTGIQYKFVMYKNYNSNNQKTKYLTKINQTKVNQCFITLSVVQFF